MKPVFFTIADKNNMPYAVKMINSLRKFHDTEVRIITEEDVVKFKDKNFFYRATPIIANELFKEGYDVVIKLDADQIITGSLDHVLNAKGVDVGVVYNWNRVDPHMYGEISLATISPQEYVNCGFVAMYSHEFVKHWLDLCMSYHFPRMAYREQGLLNVLIYYNQYKVLFLDEFNPRVGSVVWHGLRSKGEWHKCIMRDDQLILPKAQDKYPPVEVVIKVIHWAGGNDTNKMNYRIFFNEECIKYLDYLTNEKAKA